MVVCSSLFGQWHLSNASLLLCFDGNKYLYFKVALLANLLITMPLQSIVFLPWCGTEPLCWISIHQSSELFELAELCQPKISIFAFPWFIVWPNKSVQHLIQWFILFGIIKCTHLLCGNSHDYLRWNYIQII